MLRKLLLVSSVAAFGLVAVPVIGSDAGLGGTSAQAADMAVKKKKSLKVKRKITNKWQYQYVPTSSGPPGAWR